MVGLVMPNTIDPSKSCQKKASMEYAAPAVQHKTVVVTNGIQDKMLKYDYGFVSYSPTAFKIEINGTPLEQGKSMTINTNTNKITVRYEYAFLAGVYKGAKLIEFELPQEVDHVTITFSWDRESRIVIGDAKPLAITKIY
jgi:hypothetical protein